MQPILKIRGLAIALLAIILALCGCVRQRDVRSSTVEETEAMRARAGGLLMKIADRLPPAGAPPEEAMLQTFLLTTSPPYPDAFADSLWRADDGTLWIRRQGGIAGITLWQGPLDPHDRQVRHLISLTQRLPPPVPPTTRDDQVRPS